MCIHVQYGTRTVQCSTSNIHVVVWKIHTCSHFTYSGTCRFVQFTCTLIYLFVLLCTQYTELWRTVVHTGMVTFIHVCMYMYIHVPSWKVYIMVYVYYRHHVAGINRVWGTSKVASLHTGIDIDTRPGIYDTVPGTALYPSTVSYYR